MEFISKSPSETGQFISSLAKQMQGGDLVCLHGDLGAGKTTATKYLAKYFGVTDEVTSPTFVIMKNYILPKPVQGVSEFVHMDAYRLHGAPDAESIGLAEYLDRGDVLVLIEWPENIINAIPEKHKDIFIEHLDGDSRKIFSNIL